MAHANTPRKGIYPAYPAEPISNIREMLLASTRKFADKIALQSKKAGIWVPITYKELRTAVEEIAGGLATLGLRPSIGKLAIVGDNRPEWAISYLAAACTGIVCIPIDRDLRETEVCNILRLSGARALIGDSKHVEMVLGLRHKLEELETVVNMDEGYPENEVLNFSELYRRGRDRLAAGEKDFDKCSVSGDDLLAILFTSGTTGNPKGVMLTHSNVASNIVDAVKWVNLKTDDRFLSVLPIHHSYECTTGFLLSIYVGATTAYAENLRRIAENLAETRTTAVLGVPILWHALYSKIEAGMRAEGMGKVRAAKKIAAYSEKLFGLNIRRILFSKVHKKFGGHLRTLISGGAAIDPEVAKGFRELGLTFLQGYGLTESAPLIAVNRDQAFRDNAAGLPVPSVDVKIAEDGEILARGPNIMKGYYNNPEGTREALEDGWLRTGDLGYIDEDGFLYIQGRKKSVIVTSAGKNIYPEELEAEILRSPLISECLVWAQQTDNPGEEAVIEALVVPDMEQFQRSGAVDTTKEPEIEEMLRKEVKERCKKLAPFKRVAKLTVSYEELEKTTTKKVKRFLYTGKRAK